YIDELKGNFNSMSIEINKKEKLQQLEQVSNLSTYPSKRFNSFCYYDDDDDDYAIAVTPSLSTEEPDNSLKFDSSDYQSCSHEDVPEKIFSNPLFDEEIIHMKIDQHHYNCNTSKNVCRSGILSGGVTS
nr:hypothetical protein [Tanacetum cinerariifolium]